MWKTVAVSIALLLSLCGLVMTEESTDGLSKSLLEYLEQSTSYDSSSNFSAYEGTYTQVQDQFDPKNQNSFAQRFTVHAKNYKAGGPIFFYLAGEAPMEFFEFQEAYIKYDLAQEFNAMLVVLEHRYFGKSIPVPDLSTENLKYLTTRQALADGATFLASFTRLVGKSSYGMPGPAVVFGCSYSGALSAWFRLKYPDLVVGSVSPSGPELAIFDYSAFFHHFVDAAASFQGCSDRVESGIQNIAAMLQTSSGRRSLEQTFNLCQPLASDGKDDYRFKHMITTLVGSAPQFQNPPGWSLTGTCNIMTDKSISDPVQAIAEAVAFNQQFDPADGLQTISAKNEVGLPCNEWSQDSFIGYLRRTSLDFSTLGRSWFYIKCNELGYFQTSYNNSSIFFNDLTLDPLIHNCQAVYGIPGMKPDVDGTNAYYGGLSPKSSNTISTNGFFDPWSLLSITESSDNIQASVYQAGHCAPMDSATPEDPESLIQARADIRNAIASWLA